MEQAYQRGARNLAMELVRVTEAAAIAGARWMGRGDEQSADQAHQRSWRRIQRLSGIGARRDHESS